MAMDDEAVLDAGMVVSGDLSETISALQLEGIERTARAHVVPSLGHEDRMVTESAQEVEEGQIVLVYPGERIPVDGVVVEGSALVDESALTGRHVLVRHAADEHASVLGFSRVIKGSVAVRATSSFADDEYVRDICDGSHAARLTFVRVFLAIVALACVASLLAGIIIR
jgi:P-type E1-E2 ATPase